MSSSPTDNEHDRGMMKVMGMVLLSLCLLSLFIVATARLLGIGGDEGNDDPLMRQALVSRLQPVGAVRTSLEGMEVASADAAGGGAVRTAEELVNGICAGCHVGGVGGAPVIGDEAIWAERREAGLDTLVASVVNGKGSMPARGGSDYSDEEIRKAVEHIAGFEPSEESGAATETPADATAEGEVTEGAAAEGAEGAIEGAAGDEEAVAEGAASDSAATDSGDGAAVEEDVAEGAAEAEPAPADAASAEAPADDTDAAADTTDVAVAAETTDVDGGADPAAGGDGDLMALLASGMIPEGLSDQAKSTVDGICAGCHIAGVAEAPRIGDKEAWAARAELGLDALTQSVINGKGVMPARGGSQLSDEEVPLAIQYLMAKQ